MVSGHYIFAVVKIKKLQTCERWGGPFKSTVLFWNVLKSCIIKLYSIVYSVYAVGDICMMVLCVCVCVCVCVCWFCVCVEMTKIKEEQFVRSIFIYHRCWRQASLSSSAPARWQRRVETSVCVCVCVCV